MFWRSPPPIPGRDPKLPLPRRRPWRPSISTLLASPIEAHPPPLPPKDHLRETYRPRPEYDEQVGVFGGGMRDKLGGRCEATKQEGSWIGCNGDIQIGPIVQERSRSNQRYQPAPKLGEPRSFTPPTLPSSSKPNSEPNESPTGQLKESPCLDHDQTAEVNGYLQELGRSSIVYVREEQDVLPPSSTKALRFRKIDQVSLNSRSKGEDGTLPFVSSTTITRAHYTSCPQIELKLPLEGFSIDWSFLFE